MIYKYNKTTFQQKEKKRLIFYDRGHPLPKKKNSLVGVICALATHRKPLLTPPITGRTTMPTKANGIPFMSQNLPGASAPVPGWGCIRPSVNRYLPRCTIINEDGTSEKKGERRSSPASSRHHIPARLQR